jgi:hypothetical protein
MSIADELAKLNDLRTQGVLTDEEFEKQKEKLLADEGSQPSTNAGSTPAAAPAAAPASPTPAGAKSGSSHLPKVLLGVFLLGAVGALIFLFLGSSSEAGALLKRMPATSQIAFAVDLSAITSDPAFEKSTSSLSAMAAASPQGPKVKPLLEAMPISSLKALACTVSAKETGACLLKGDFDAATVAPLIADLASLESVSDVRNKKAWSNGKEGKNEVKLVIYADGALGAGESEALDGLLAALDGEAKTIADNGTFTQALGQIDSGATLVFVGGKDGQAYGAGSIGLQGELNVQGAVFVENEKLKTQLPMASTMFEQGKAQALLELSGAGQTPKEAMAMFASYAEMARELVESAALEELDGGLKITASAKLPDGGLFAQAAVMSAVAIPAFIKYQRRAKTSEAIDQLDKIYKGASVYYSTPYVANTGQKLPCQFPRKQVCVPAGSPCDYPDKKYPADPAIWNTPTWSALSFQISDSHYFKYCFDAEGTLKDATFRATAHADLDCDGTWSTFQRIAFGDEQANFAECALHGAPAMFVDQETE